FRFLYFMAIGRAGGHVQSLILACTLIIMGFLTFMIGLVADVIAASRKLLQDTQYHARKMEYDAIYAEQRMEEKVSKLSRN
ncbi:MAG: glycosyltransferase family 2 protein, partial [Clostridia bacterium]|nr:glycosyltransferase family 2 protein [Clostridia bacterium]